MMKRILAAVILLSALSVFGASTYEYAPVAANMTAINTFSPANRITALTTGITSTNLDGMAGDFVFVPGGSATVDGTNVFTGLGSGLVGQWHRINRYIYGAKGAIGILNVSTNITAGSLTVATNATIGGTLTVGGGIIGSITVTNLTPTRVVFVGSSTNLVDDGDMTFATDTLTVTKILAPTSVSTPSLISTTAIGITPAAGSGVNVTTSGSGNFAINTTELVADTSVGIGINTATPQARFDVNGDSRFGGWMYVDRTGGTISEYLGWRVRGAAEASNFGNALGNGAVEVDSVGTAGVIFGTIDAKPVAFGTDNVVRMQISSAGVVNVSGLTVLMPVTTDASKNLTSAAIALGSQVSGDLPFANIVQIATGTLLGRNTALTGDIEVITDIATAITIGGAYIYRVGGTDVTVPDGGTGVGTFTSNGVIYGQGTSALAVTAQGGANTVLVANAGAPSFSAAITVGTSVTSPAIIASTSLTTPSATISGLTSGRIPIVSTGGLLVDDSDLTFATDTLTATKIVGSTSITDSGLTATRVTFAGVGGLLTDDADVTFATDTLTATKVLAPTSVSSPSLISTAAITATPAAGNNFNIITSGAGNFAVNSTQLFVESAGNIGLGNAGPNIGGAGGLVITIANTAGRGILEMGNNAADGAGNDMPIRFVAGGNSGGSGEKRIASIEASTAGATANQRGGVINFATKANAGALTSVLFLTETQTVGIGTTTPLAKFAVNGGGAAIGEDADPGDNNLKVVGLTTTGTLNTLSTSTFGGTMTISALTGPGVLSLNSSEAVTALAPPGTDDYILSSKIDGTLTWVPPGTPAAFTLTAGGGLTGTTANAVLAAATLAIGAGTGITVNADDIAVNQGANFTWTGTHGFGNTVSLTALTGPGVISINSSEAIIALAPPGVDDYILSSKIDGTLSWVVQGTPASFTLTAGAGLTGTTANALLAAATLTIGAGTGITVNADDVALDTSSTRNTDHAAVTLTAGAGLTGGGDITANRTFTVGAGTGITVNADDVAVSTGAAFVWSGTHSFGNTVSLTGLTGPGVISINSSEAVVALAAPGVNGYVLSSQTDGTLSWIAPAGVGTVTSVAMTVPSILSVAGSPVTTSGTLAVTLATQSANTVFAGPTSGAAATPAFRAIVAADLPSSVVFDTRTLTAGAGLTGGGTLAADRTFTVGAGTGITVNADDVALSAATITSLGLADTAVQPTRQIISGGGLTGGGTLAADRTLVVGAGTGITVNADDVAISDTAVTPGSYGSATQVGTFTVDLQGRLTAAANATITGTAPGGSAGGALTGTYPNPGVNLSTTTFITGDLPLSNIVQIANNTILGNFTGGTADIQVLTSITSANLRQVLSDETGGSGLAVFNVDPVFTTSISTPLIVTASGDLAITPASGSGVIVNLSTSDQFIVSSATPGGVIRANNTSALITSGDVIGTLEFYSNDVSGDATGIAGAIQSFVDTSDRADGLYFKTRSLTDGANATTKMTILANGDIGLGNTSPNIGAAGGLVVTIASPTGRGLLEIANNAADGIGNDMPIRFVAAANTGGSAEKRIASIEASTAGATANQRGGVLNFSTKANAGALTSVLYISETQTVGIGTTTPSAKLAIGGGLHVGGDSDPGSSNLAVDGTSLLTGAITASSLTALKWVKTDINKVLVSADITVSDIGSGATLTAGAGLTGTTAAALLTAATVAVGAGVGITVAADSVAVDQSGTFTPTWLGLHTFQGNGVRFNFDNTGDEIWSSYVGAEVIQSLSVRGDGQMLWGPGDAAVDASLSRSGVGVLTISTNLIITGLTALRATATDADKKLVSSATTSTELGYVSGVTSAIQTQLGTKAATTTTITAGAGLTGGGDLSANRTLTVGAGTGITANADDVAVDQGFAPTWTGLHTFNLGSTDFGSTAAYSTTPGHFIRGTVKYNAAGDFRTLAYALVGKENDSDGNDAGHFAIYTRPNGGVGTLRFDVSSAGLVNIPNLAASRAVVTDTLQNLAISATTATEIGYVSGVTSAIQTQLGTKAATATTITAGAGLTGGGDLSANRTLTVGAGTGITVNADDVALSAGSIASLALADTAVQPARQIISGSGLTGGGTLAADRTLAVGSGVGITANADDVAVDQTSAFTPTWRGLHTWRQDVDGVTSLQNWRNLDNTMGSAAATIRVSGTFGETGSAATDTAFLMDFTKEQEWTTTASTRDSAFSLGLARDGVSTTVLNINSAGLTTVPGLNISGLTGPGVLSISSGETVQALAAPGVNGYVLSSQTDGTLAWVVNGAPSSFTLTAGAGLTGTTAAALLAAATVAVGAGNGISVAADSVAVNEAFTFAWTAPHTRTGAPIQFIGASATDNVIDSNIGGNNAWSIYADGDMWWSDGAGGTSDAGLSRTAAGVLKIDDILTVDTGYRIGNAAASGNYLRGNGANFVSSAIQATDIAAVVPTATSSQVLGAGTAYTLTATYARVDFGTTDAQVTLPAAGTYLVTALIGMTSPRAGTTTRVDFELYNSTDAAAVAGSIRGEQVQAAALGGQIVLQNVVTVAASKVIQIYGQAPTAGQDVDVISTETSVSYVRLF